MIDGSGEKRESEKAYTKKGDRKKKRKKKIKPTEQDEKQTD